MEDEEWEDVLVVSFVPLDGRLSYTGDDLDLPYKDLSNIVHPKLTTVIDSKATFQDSDIIKNAKLTKLEQRLYELAKAEPKLASIVRLKYRKKNSAWYAARTADNQVHIMDKNFEILSSTVGLKNEVTEMIPHNAHLYCFSQRSIIKVSLKSGHVVQEQEIGHDDALVSVTSRVYTSPRGLFYIVNSTTLLHLKEDLTIREIQKGFKQANALYVDYRQKDSWLVMNSKGLLSCEDGRQVTVPPQDPTSGYFYSMHKAYSRFLILGEHQDISHLNVLHAVRKFDLQRTSMLVLQPISTCVPVRTLSFFSPTRNLEYFACTSDRRIYLCYLNGGELGLAGSAHLVLGFTSWFTSLPLEGLVFTSSMCQNVAIFKLT